MSRALAVPAFLVVAFVANAWWLVFGAATPATSPLAGQVLLAGLLGGTAMAFTRGALLILTPLTAVVADSVTASDGASAALRLRVARAVCFMAGFAVAFCVAISGAPVPVAGLVYRHHRIADVIGGVALLIYGLVVAARPGSSTMETVRPRGRFWVGTGAAGLLGLATGLVLAHDLDPLYDSVFFLTGNARAASHAPLTVALFTLGLSLVALTGTIGAVAMASRLVVGDRILAGLRIGGGFLTALLGSVVLLDRFSAIRALLLS